MLFNLFSVDCLLFVLLCFVGYIGDLVSLVFDVCWCFCLAGLVWFVYLRVVVLMVVRLGLYLSVAFVCLLFVR